MIQRDLFTLLVVVALLSAIPAFVTANTVLNFLVFMLIITLAGQGWNLLAGFGGQFSFGHAAFFGTGAYTTAVLQVQYGVNAWVGFVIAVAVGSAVGWVIGFLSFRSGLRGSYFALVTLAFAEVFRIVANSSPLTGGAAGLLVKLAPQAENFQFVSRATFYWIALAMVGTVLVISMAITRSRFGAQLVAVRENEEAAKALGVDVLRVKLKAITLSAGITAAAGVFYVQYFLYVDAQIGYGSWISVEAILAPMVGGIGTVYGPLIGAFTLHSLGEVTKGFAGPIPGIDLVFFGVILIVTVAFAPDGILGLLRRARARLQPRSKPAAGED